MTIPFSLCNRKFLDFPLHKNRIYKNKYINAAVNDGSQIAELMRYFKTADPNDSSQGVLSERVHFLKTDERGIEYMCEVTDQFVQWGRLAEKREVTANLAAMGMPAERIAQVVNESIGLVKEWLNTAK